MKRIKEKLDHEKLLGTTTETSSVINESAQLGLDNLSKRERAIRVLDEGKISVDTKLHTFTIMGSTCPHLVTLFPKETCTYPSTTQCYHILAAKLAIGQELEDSKKKLILHNFIEIVGPEEAKNQVGSAPIHWIMTLYLLQMQWLQLKLLLLIHPHLLVTT